MALSPMMKHYLHVKDKHKDCLVFYRLGDFYELFFEDAKRASELLGLTLTGRDCGLEERAPMCGVPYHAAETYIAKLVEQGEKVAICEQLTEPTKGALVERDVIRIVTAGTLIEEGLLDEKANNFIASVFRSAEGFSLAWADITTGDFYVQVYMGKDAASDLLDALVRINPAEIISNAAAFESVGRTPLVEHKVLPKFHCYSEWEFNAVSAKNTLLSHFGVKNLDAYRLEKNDLAVSSAGALIAYLKETQKHSLKIISHIKLETANDYMILDVNAIKNLELTRSLRENKRYGTLLWLLDKTKTNMGARTLQNWLLNPLNKPEQIEYRLAGVEELYKNTLIRQSLSEQFRSVRDIGRLAGKISNGNLNPRDCLALAASLEVIPNLKFQLVGLNAPIISDLLAKVKDFGDIAKLLNDAIDPEAPNTLKDGGYIRPGFNQELDEYRALRENSKTIIAQMEQRERAETGIKNLKISYNRIFGYFIEVTNSFKNMVPYHYIRKQTLANAERYITEELKTLEEKILNSNEQALRLEARLFAEIKEKLLKEIESLTDASDSLGVLDCLNAFATVARENRYVRPQIVEGGRALNIVDGRHPVVEALSSEQFIPNDTYLDTGENRTMIITGPNMAGKSTYMRQVALIVLMAHIGSFVPARSAEIPLVDRIFTRIGASDNLVLDQSTFMVEMTEVANILLNATEKSLLILDEVGRGTSTYDGLSIAWAVVEYITKNLRAKTLFATHYHELTELEGVFDGVKNYKITVRELNNTIVFLRKIMRGGANRSFGIEVASLAGVPKEVTGRAKEILKDLEKNDLAARPRQQEFDIASEKPPKSEVERILADINLDNVTPMQAFHILGELKEKVN